MSENGNSLELTPKQETVIAALLAGHTIQTSAKAAHVGERTVHRWLKLPHFQQAYKAAQKQVFNQALTGLMLKVDKAIERLEYHLDNEDTLPSTQVRAAQIVIEQAITVYKTSELEQEIAELKELLQVKEQWQQ